MRSRHVGAMLGIVVALLVVGDLPVVHDHGAPGLYNEECPLARLGTTSPRTFVWSDPAPFLLACAPETAPTAPRTILASFVSASFVPRAPPSSSPLPSGAVIV